MQTHNPQRYSPKGTKTMKLHHLVKSTTLALALAVGLGASGARANENDEDEQKVEMKDLTADVQKTFHDYLAGGNVTRVVKESENGKTLYSADVQKSNGEKVEIKVAEDGKLVRVNANDNEEENDNEAEHED
jgi:uncharacterized membrane protein YkoI